MQAVRNEYNSTLLVYMPFFLYSHLRLKQCSWRKQEGVNPAPLHPSTPLLPHLLNPTYAHIWFLYFYLSVYNHIPQSTCLHYLSSWHPAISFLPNLQSSIFSKVSINVSSVGSRYLTFNHHSPSSSHTFLKLLILVLQLNLFLFSCPLLPSSPSPNPQTHTSAISWTSSPPPPLCITVAPWCFN